MGDPALWDQAEAVSRRGGGGGGGGILWPAWPLDLAIWQGVDKVKNNGSSGSKELILRPRIQITALNKNVSTTFPLDIMSGHHSLLPD